MYMVTSKPKRRSEAAGLVHMVTLLELGCATKIIMDFIAPASTRVLRKPHYVKSLDGFSFVGTLALVLQKVPLAQPDVLGRDLDQLIVSDELDG